jgi:hypothetical protein
MVEASDSSSVNSISGVGGHPFTTRRSWSTADLAILKESTFKRARS